MRVEQVHLTFDAANGAVEVLIDGEKLEGVVSLEFKANANEHNPVTLTIVVERFSAELKNFEYAKAEIFTDWKTIQEEMST